MSEIPRIVFWQPILSIHQAPLLLSLQNLFGVEVVLITEREAVGGRSSQGWHVPDYGPAKLIKLAGRGHLESVLDIYEDSLHVISGVATYPFISMATKRLLKKRRTVVFQSERWDPAGVAGLARNIKYWSRRGLINRNQRVALLAMGERGVRAFTSVGFDGRKIAEFGYFTEVRSVPSVRSDRNGLVYVGKLSTRKNVVPLARMVKESEKVSSLTFVGDGPLRRDLESIAGSDPRFRFLGTLPNVEVPGVIDRHEILVLPSLYDGWGAVVNEALLGGTPVVCSDSVGAASVLFDGAPWRGISFRSRSLLQMRDAIELGVVQASTKVDYASIREWAENSLSPDAGATYLMELLVAVEQGSADLRSMKPPWRTSSEN